MSDSGSNTIKYQLVHRALAGYTYYEVYQDQKLIGNIKIADVEGAPIRVRGIHEIDLICRADVKRRESGEPVREFVDDHGVCKDRMYCDEQGGYHLSEDGDKDITVLNDERGYSCILDGEEILHIDETAGNPYVWKNRLEGVDNIIGVKQIMTHNIVSVKELLMLVAGMFIDFKYDTGDVHKSSRCYHCMEEFDYGYEICPHCGHDITQNNKGQALPLGHILAGRYMVGEMFFAGGSFLLYYGWDEEAARKVVIREFFPKDKVKRLQGANDIIVYPEDLHPDYLLELDHYMEDYHNVQKLPGYGEAYSLIDGFEANLTGYLVFDTMDGVPLLDYVEKRDGRLPVDEAIDIVIKICRALSTLHDSGYVFGELNYKHIYMINNKQIHIEPYEEYQQLLQRKIGEDINSWKQDMNRYIAPELYKETVLVGPWIDVYSIGAVLYRLISGHEPPDAMEDLVADRLKNDLKKSADIPEELIGILEHTMEPEYTKRFYDADAVINALSLYKNKK